MKTPWSETYPGQLRAKGYYVGHVGKWHGGKFPAREFDFGRAYSGTHWVKDSMGKRVHVTQKNQDDALDFLATRPNDKPFMLNLWFFAPHADDENPKQYLPQPDSMKLYQDIDIDIPIIIFTGDNGYFHCDRGLADKWYPYDESIRVPMIVVDPRMPAESRGKTNDDFVLNVDLAPTLLAAVGIPAPKVQQQSQGYSAFRTGALR